MQVSELLRGEGLYPTWELTSSVITVLQIPRAPMLHLWQSAAIEVHKDRAWIENCIKQFIQIPGEDVAPVDQACFVATSTPHYIRYGSVFLGTTLATVAVNETNHLLWLRWEEILGSRDLHQTACDARRGSCWCVAGLLAWCVVGWLREAGCTFRVGGSGCELGLCPAH